MTLATTTAMMLNHVIDESRDNVSRDRKIGKRTKITVSKEKITIIQEAKNYIRQILIADMCIFIWHNFVFSIAGPLMDHFGFNTLPDVQE